MFDSQQFDELTKKLLSILPSSFQTIEQDLQQKFKDVLQVAFSHLDLVTREEFDVQTKVLARTREKLEHLQTQLEQIQKEKNAHRE